MSLTESDRKEGEPSLKGWLTGSDRGRILGSVVFVVIIISLFLPVIPYEYTALDGSRISGYVSVFKLLTILIRSVNR